MRGKFIVFEGLDGSGKTSVMSALAEELERRGWPFRLEQEPTDGMLGRVLRDVIMKRATLGEEAMALLFAADRLEHIENQLLPCLNSGVHVLCDRYLFSNIAYQSISLPMARVIEYNRTAIERLMPELTVFIDVAPEECARRIGAAREGRELYDDRGTGIRRNYLESFQLLKDSANVASFDGSQSPEKLLASVWQAVETLLASIDLS